MTSSGLEDFFIPGEANPNPSSEAGGQATVGEGASAPRGIHSATVPAGQPALPQHPVPDSTATNPPPPPSSEQGRQSGTPLTSDGPSAGMEMPPAPAVHEDPSATQPAQTAPAGVVASTAPAAEAPAGGPAPVTAAARPAARTREQQLSAALTTFMRVSSDVEATALVSLDGFIMAAALPEGMHEDRVGAMSAAILGLGERAAAELGRGRLSQIFIEGDTGYVLLMAAGDRAVLVALARLEAKLGLLLYDMRDVAEAIADILG